MVPRSSSLLLAAALLVGWRGALLQAQPAAAARDDNGIPTTASPLADVAPPTSLSDLRREIAELVGSGSIRSLAVVAIAEGEVVWAESFGWAIAEEEVPATLRTAYPVASISKSLTGLASTVLRREGAFTFDAPVREILGADAPRVSPGIQEELKVRDLAAMKAGMPHGGLIWMRDLPEPEEASARVVRDHAVVAAPPGTEFQYSNYTYGVLERVVARASGQGFCSFLKERVLTPLGMANTAASPADLPSGAIVADVYFGGRRQAHAPLFTPTGGQGLYSCAEDLASLARGHLGLLPRAARGPSQGDLDESRWPAEAGVLQPDDQYWLGWGRFSGPAGMFELTNGQAMESTSALLLCRARRAAVVCVTNSEWYQESGGERLADWVAIRGMNALVPGCSDAYSAAAAEAEKRGGAGGAGRTALSVERLRGEWRGTINVAGEARDCLLRVTGNGGASFEAGEFRASARELRPSASGLVGRFTSRLPFLFAGDAVPVSFVDLTLGQLKEDSLFGDAVIGVFRPDAGVTGTAPCLVQFRRAAGEKDSATVEPSSP